MLRKFSLLKINRYAKSMFSDKARNMSYVCFKDDNKIKKIFSPNVDDCYYNINNIHKGKEFQKDEIIASIEASKVCVDMVAPSPGKYYPLVNNNDEIDKNTHIFDIDDGTNDMIKKKLEYFDYEVSREFETENLPVSLDSLDEKGNIIDMKDLSFNKLFNKLFNLYDYGTMLLQKNDPQAITIFEYIINNILDQKNKTREKFTDELNLAVKIGEKFADELILAVFYNAGTAYFNNGLIEKAKMCFDNVLKAKICFEDVLKNTVNRKYNKIYTMTYSSYAVIHYISNRLDLAITNYKEALEFDLNNGKAHLGLAICYMVTNKNNYTKEITKHFIQALASTSPYSLLHERINGQYQDFLINRDKNYENNMCNTPNITEVYHLSRYFGMPYSPTSITIFQKPTDTHPEKEQTSNLMKPGTDINQVKKLLEEHFKKSKKINLLTGAGLSKHIGLPTRKDLWQIYDRDESVHIATFRKDPTKLWNVVKDFYNQALNKNSVSSEAYDILKKIDKKVNAIITQNVDTLHIDSLKNVLSGKSKVIHNDKKVIELHGTLNELICPTCFKIFDVPSIKHLNTDLPQCTKGTILKPNVVLFGESVDPEKISSSQIEINSEDILLVIGTASDVSPAADMIRYAVNKGKTVIEINPTESRITSIVDYYLKGSAEEILRELFEKN